MATAITNCATLSCAFNSQGCTALAITIGGTPENAACDTFIAIDARAGVPGSTGQVGACKRLECVHNTDLICTADAVSVGGDVASCLSYATN